MVRPPAEFRHAAEAYVCVRVTNIDRLDLTLYPFDYDLTMAILLANADGTVYHRYGGRSHLSPMSMSGLVDLMTQGLETHRQYLRNPYPPVRQAPEYLPEIINERLRGRIKPVFGCFHCHYAREARQHLAVEEGTWSPNQFWIWPLPERVGLILDQDRQYQVKAVRAGSAAAESGIEGGDVLLSLDGQRVLTKYDVQWILHERDGKAGRLAFEIRRGTGLRKGFLELEEGWRVGDPGDHLWRVGNVYTEHMIKFLPTPGFLGTSLTTQERQELRLAPEAFALKVTQLALGAHLCGIRQGDVVLGAGFCSELDSVRAFYAHCEDLRRAGLDIKMRLLRQGSEMNVMMGIDRLNDARIERASRAELGFIVQELPGGGLRVGHVSDGSNAERAGVKLGDRILRVDGVSVSTARDLATRLNPKNPGDLIGIEMKRQSAPLLIGFVLSGGERRRSDLAMLSAPVVDRDQLVECVTTIRLPEGKHVYSVHRQSVGRPTQAEFRGTGYELVGELLEPEPRREEGPLGMDWILEGEVSLRQTLRVTDPKRFYLLLHVYAQVCDDRSCHEFRAMVATEGRGTEFTEFQGRFEEHALVSAAE